jgi:nicotinate phosphoribosyltransferase
MRVAGGLSRGGRFIFGKSRQYMVNVARERVAIPIQCIDERDIERYNELADAYGMGTTISNAPVVDFSMDIIEVDGGAVAKRGKMPGRKRVLRCKECFKTRVCPLTEMPGRCSCGGTEKELLVPFFSKGYLEQFLPKPSQIREFVSQQLSKVEL